MKPVIDHPDIGIFFGRPERSHILAEKLRARGFPVTFYNHQGMQNTYVPVRYAFLPAFLRILSTSHQIYLTGLSFVPSLCLSLNRSLRGVPYIFNATGVKSAMYQERSRQRLFPRLAERWVYPALMERVLAGASRIVCNSRYLQVRLESQFPHYAQKMLTIYNGIEFDRFASGQPIPIDGIPAHAPKLLAVMSWNFAGKASAAKLLIDAMGPITEKYPEAQLIIVANAKQRQYAQQNEDYRAARPWGDSVKIFYNQPNIPDFLASSDLFLYATPPDSNDSLPRVLLEAHAAGLPIVTTATTGCPEVVEDGVSGFLVPYEAAALAERAVHLLADPGKRQEMGRRGRERVHALFNWDRMAEAYATLFRQVASDHTPRARTKSVVEKRGVAP